MQADQKLSYALMHCNPQREANIRFVSVMRAAYVLDLYSYEKCNLGWGVMLEPCFSFVVRNVRRLLMT